MLQDLLGTNGQKHGVTRRRMMKSTAAASGAVALGAVAGCSSDDSPGTNTTTQPPLPDYARWIGEQDIPEPETDETITFIRADFQALKDISQQDLQGEPDIGSDLPDAEQQFIATPIYGSAILLLLMGFGLMPFGKVVERAYGNTFNDQTTTADENTTTSTPSQQITSGMFVGQSIIMEGSYDEEALVEGVTSFEKHSERDGYTIYTGVSSDQSFTGGAGYAFAVSDSAIVFVTPESDDTEDTTDILTTTTGENTTTVSDSEKTSNAVTLLNNRLDVVTGNATRAADASPELDHGFRVVGDKMFILGGSKPTTTDDETTTTTETEPTTTTSSEFDEINSVLDSAQMMVMGTSLPSKNNAKTALSAYYSSAEDVPNTETFEAFVANAKTSDVSVDGQTVDVSGAWTNIRSTTAPTTTQESA